MLWFISVVAPLGLSLEIMILHVIVFKNREMIEKVNIETNANFLRAN